MSLPEFEISLSGMAGESFVRINGQEIEGVTDIEIRQTANGTPTVRLEILASSVSSAIEAATTELRASER